MNAMMTVTISKIPGFSFKMKIDMTIAANGDSLFSMFASAMAILLIAQKFAKMPIDPTVLRASKERQKTPLMDPDSLPRTDDHKEGDKAGNEVSKERLFHDGQVTGQFHKKAHHCKSERCEQDM